MCYNPNNHSLVISSKGVGEKRGSSKEGEIDCNCCGEKTGGTRLGELNMQGNKENRRGGNMGREN